MNIPARLMNWGRDVWNRYTSPLIAIDDPLRRREVQLLASLLLTTLALIFIIVIWVVVTSDTGLPVPQIISSSSTFILTLIVLWLVRRGYEQSAITLLVISGNTVLLIGAWLLGDRAGFNYLDYMVIVAIFGGLFMRVRHILLMLCFQLTGMVVVAPHLHGIPFVEVVGGPMLFTSSATAILMVVAHYWRRTQQEQREVLTASEAQYRLLVERNRDIIYSQDLHGKILTINGAVERMLGHTPASVIGKNILDFIRPEDQSTVHNYLRNVLHDEDIPPLEMQVQSLSGEWIWAEIRLSPIMHTNGSISMAGVVRDISPRRLAEDALRSSNLRYRLISELSSDYAFETIRTPDDRIQTLWVLDSVQRMLGYSVKEILALDDVRILYHPDDWAQAKADIRQAFEGKAARNEYRMLTKSGETRWVQIYRSPVKEPDGRVQRVYGIAKDMTENHYNAEQQVKLAVQREQIRVVNLVVLAVSHDFRTALSTIETSRYLIERKVDAPNRAVIQSRLDSIQQSVQHLTNQIESLYLLSALTEPIPEAFDWNEMVESEVEDYREDAENKEIKLIFDGQADLPVVMADAGKLRHALGHLLKNALAHTQVGGIVRVSTLLQDGQVCARVQDTGPGIAQGQLELIFAPFYRPDEARTQQTGGVGLGLTLVRMIAEAHQGQVRVDSQLGKGSMFILSVPAQAVVQAHK